MDPFFSVASFKIKANIKAKQGVRTKLSKDKLLYLGRRYPRPVFVASVISSKAYMVIEKLAPSEVLSSLEFIGSSLRVSLNFLKLDFVALVKCRTPAKEPA